MSKGITIRDDLWDRWNREKDQDGETSLSFSEWIDSLIDQGTGLQEAVINAEGRIIPKDMNMSELREKVIEWRVIG